MKAGARRLEVLYRAFTADPVRPRLSEATFFRRYITEAQLTDLLERLVQLLLPNAFDQSGFQGVVHERLLRIHEEIRPMQVDFLNPLGAPMMARRSRHFYVGMIALVSTRRSVYQHSLRNSRKGSVRASQRLASIGAESMASTRYPFRQSRADIAALLGGGGFLGQEQGRACRDGPVGGQLRQGEPRIRRTDHGPDALHAGSSQGAIREGGALRAPPLLAGATPGEQPKYGQGMGHRFSGAIGVVTGGHPGPGPCCGAVEA